MWVNRAVENSLNGFDIIDHNGRFIYVNEAYLKMWGYDSSEEVIGTSPNLHCADPNTPIEIIKALKESGQYKNEFKGKRKDGSLFDVMMYAHLGHDHSGNELYFGTSIDISQRIKYEEELYKAKEIAERSNHLKTVFLNNMSHEIRTPMNGIIGFSSFMAEPGLSDEKRKYYSKILENSCNQLLRIIDDILEISRLETKQVTLSKSEFLLNDLLMEIFAIFDLKSKERTIPLYLKKGLSDEESRIETDRSKLFKVLTNLIENAIKFTSKGYIEFGYKLEQNNIVIYVKDTGIGISKEHQEIIFQRFVQAERDLTRQFGGLGIGLSIAKENSQLLGGEISVQSEKGKGSTFYVTIPYIPVSKENISLEKETTSATSIKQEKNKNRILVVEDEEVNYLYLEEILNMADQHHLEILHAKDGKEALDFCKKDGDIHLVFMDIKMPVMGGYEATELIKKIYPELTIIALTAYSTEEDRKKSIESGCTDFISKPVNRGQIMEVLDKYLDK